VIGRYLGVDIGERRIGLAIGDPSGTLASTLDVLPARGRARDAAAVAEIAAREGVTVLVVGLPLSLSGADGPMAEKARRFGAALAQASGLEVNYWDERLTTSGAQRYLRDAGMRREKRARTIDSAAAAVMLQSYLDRQRR
jgi:putative Holliday junction resolvase